MKFIDLYAGIGGFRFALESLGHDCVFSAEKDKHAIETYIANFPSHNPSFDMNILESLSNSQIDKIIPDHDILCAGFPCQPFSIGGVKKGFSDFRGNQFFNILKILDAKKPKFIFLENVSNIIKHDKGRTFKIIKEELKKREYHIQDKPVIVSPHEIGVPQRRMRAFFFAERNQKKIHVFYPRKEKERKIVNLGTGSPINSYYTKVINAWEEFAKNVKTLKNKKIPDIWLDEMISGKIGTKKDKKWKIKYLSDMKDFYTLNKKFVDSWIKKYDVLKFKRRERKFEWRAGKTNSNFKEKILMLRTSGLRIMKRDIFPTLVAMGQIPIIFDEKMEEYRHLTLDEVRKLQSFPKNFVHNKSSSKSFKQFGNAVNVDVIKQIAKSFIK